MPKPPDTAAIVLAGGRRRRKGGARKALLPLGGRTLLDHVLERLPGQVRPIVASANDPEIAEAAGALPVLSDHHDDRRGPLAGLLAGMGWCRATDAALRPVVPGPVDCLFIPRDLVAMLRTAAADSAAEVVVAASGGHDHPTVAL